MARDDEVFDGAWLDPSSALSGPRRSTFTPPAAAADSPPAEPAEAPTTDAPTATPEPADAAMPEPESRAPEPAPVDDDVLASALAADLSRLAPPIPSMVQPSPLGGLPDPAAAPPVAPLAAPPVPPAPPPSTPQPAPAQPAPAAETPAWASAPAPDPLQAAPTPQRPVRRSLPDEDLEVILAEAQGAGTLSALDQLQSQMALRETEVREFRAWEATMLAMGTPDAAQAVEEARAEFAGVLPRSTPPRHADLPPTSRPEPPIPAPAVEPVPAPPTVTPEAAGVAEPPVAAEPAMPPVAAEPPAPPVVAAPPVVVPQPEPPVVADPPVPPTDVVPLPSWEVPAPSPTWAPEVEPPADAFAYDPLTPPTAMPAPTVAPDSDDKPAPAPEPRPELSDPPPLIEPPRFGGPPPTPISEPLLADADPIIPPAGSIASMVESGDAVEADEVVEAELLDESPVGPADRPATEEPLGFDDLLAGTPPEAADGDLPYRNEPTAESAVQELFIEPLPVSADEAVPTDTGSIPVIDQAFIEDELDDDVDETDRVGGPGPTGPIMITTPATGPIMVEPPSGPIPTVRIPDDEVVLIDNEPVRLKVFSLEAAGLEPTPTENRVGRSVRLFWIWFSANASVLSLGLGAIIFTVGMSLRQSVVSILVGVALSFIPLGLSTLAGKRSGQPTMVVSRATFGVVGNVIPALIAVVSRVFWGAVMLWLLAESVSAVLVGAGLAGAFGGRQIMLLAAGAATLIAVFIAFAGYALIARVQLIASIISLVFIGGLIALTWPLIDLGTALSTPDGSWILAITGAVVVFSFVGLVWAHSGGDLARYQRVTSSGAAGMFGATFGATVPAFVLIAYGAVLAASNPAFAAALAQSPVDALAGVLPLWYPVPLIAAVTISLLSGVIISLYSGGFALVSMGVRLPRTWSGVIIALPVLGLALLFALGVTGGLTELIRDGATTLAVPTAAWVGIFAAEMMIRNRRFESDSLLARGGVYASVRWVNLIGLVVITAIGFALTSATVPWLSWQGYGFTLLGISIESELAATDVGVLIALALGILLPIVAGIPAIRRQEATRL